MKKADFIIIAVVGAIVAVMLIFLYAGNSNSGSYVQIEIDGKVVDTLPLNENFQKEIKTDNNGTNTIIIEDGYAFMSEANCPDKICTNHKKINRSGESIICLPHKVVVTVINNNANNEIDAVA